MKTSSRRRMRCAVNPAATIPSRWRFTRHRSRCLWISPKKPTKTIPYFNIEVPTELPGVDTNILDPRDTYADASEWDEKAKDLAGRFIKNFAKYESNEAGKALVSAGPQL